MHMKLYFIRHGETVWNTQAKLQGKSDIPLNEKGVALARVTGEALADVPFAAIYSSPLKRALQTAQLVAGDRDVPIVTDRRLEEIGFGIWEGLSCHKDHYEIPSDSFQDFFLDPFGYQPPAQGETVRHVCGRTADFLEELIRKMGKRLYAAGLDELLLSGLYGRVLERTRAPQLQRQYCGSKGKGLFYPG